MGAPVGVGCSGLSATHAHLRALCMHAGPAQELWELQAAHQLPCAVAAGRCVCVIVCAHVHTYSLWTPSPTATTNMHTHTHAHTHTHTHTHAATLSCVSTSVTIYLNKEKHGYKASAQA